LVADPTLIDERDRMQVVLQVSLLHLVLAGALLSSAAPFTVAWLARAWTAMVPVRSGTWHLARNTVVAKGDRLAKSVVPVMFTVGLLIGMLIMGETLVASLAAGGAPVDDFSSEGLGSLLVLLGLPLAVSISGAVGSLVMMTRQRSAELALDGVLGATPAQRAAIPVLEALIVTITATMLAAVMVAMMLVVPVLHFETVLGGFAVGVPWLVVVQVVGALAAVVVAATALPATPSLRQPAPKVIARLVAD
jgi:putative ABC transport system permease protein